MTASKRLCEGRVALVTGASQGGTGTALALRLAAEGAAVAITARSEPGLAECQQTIEAIGGKTSALPCDLADPDGGRNDLLARAEAELGPVDILVNSAAEGPYQPFDSFAIEDLRHTQELNVWAPWLLIQQAIPGMRERGRGWVLNITTSVAEFPPGPPFANSGPAKAGTLYGGSKAMLNRLTVGIASEVEGQGIAVNALTPQAAILTRTLAPARDNGLIHADLFEPLDTMVEAALALCTTRIPTRSTRESPTASICSSKPGDPYTTCAVKRCSRDGSPRIYRRAWKPSEGRSRAREAGRYGL